MLSRGASAVAHLGDQAAAAIAESGVSVADLLPVLDEERQTYFREHYIEQP